MTHRVRTRLLALALSAGLAITAGACSAPAGIANGSSLPASAEASAAASRQDGLPGALPASLERAGATAGQNETDPLESRPHATGQANPDGNRPDAGPASSSVLGPVQPSTAAAGLAGATTGQPGAAPAGTTTMPGTTSATVPATAPGSGSAEAPGTGSTAKPTSAATQNPTATDVKPTAAPTRKPTAAPTAKPTAAPTAKPTAAPTAEPTAKPTATPTATPTTAPSETGTGLTSAQWRSEVFRLTNLERGKEGLPAFKSAISGLQSAANTRAREIAIRFDHTRPDGSVCFTAVDEAGIAYWKIGENILWATAGSLSPAEVVAKWMNSDGHRKNILDPNLTMLGVGFYRANGKDYFVQLFIRPQ